MAVSARLAALGLVVLVAACGSQPEAEQPPPPPPLPVAERVPADMAALISAVDAFGLDLLTAPTLADQPNLVVSPVSVALVLEMVGVGAEGETAAQMRKVLHLPDGVQPRAPTFDRTDLKMSNTVWAQRGLTLVPGYRDTLRSRFGATLGEADFLTDPDSARRRINRTVADQTAGKITDLFPPESIDSDTRVVLSNAIYLKAAWAREFDPAKTGDAPFTRGDGSTVTVPMMHNDPHQEPIVSFGYAANRGYQVVTVPYRGGKLAFTVIVPAAVDAVRAKGIAALLGEVRPALVALAMPRFTVGSAMNLTDTLRAAGMPAAFTADADFGGITHDADLWIDTVQHSTFVQVDEKGTVAAAAAAANGASGSFEPTYTVTVDRPFLFVITDVATGAPLFLGRVTDPTASG